MAKKVKDGQQNIKLWYFLKPDKGLLFLLALTGTIFNIGLVLIPVFEGWLVQCLFDIFGKNKVFLDMLRLVLYYLLAMIVVQITRYLKRMYVRKIANNMVVRMRDSLYVGILKKSLSRSDVGQLVTRASMDVEIVAEGTRKTLTEIFDTGVLLISFAITMFIYDWIIALIALFFTPIACFIAEILKKVVYKHVSEYKLSQETLSNATYDRITNASLYRVYGSDRIKNAEYQKNVKDYEKKSVLSNVWENTLQPIYNVIAMIGVIFIIYLGGRNFLGIGFRAWDIAIFTTFISCYTKVADKSSKVARLFNSVQKSQVSWKRLKNLLILGDGEFLQKELEFNKKPVYLTVNGVNCSYQYGKTILDDVSFTASSGQIIGVTGAVASGKSTLGKLLLGELEYNGSITLFDKELKDLTDVEKATYISYLGHNPELFSDTILENVAMGKDADLAHYLEIVKISQEVSEMTGGVNTKIGSDGNRLSGGQKARVALARTLCHAKNIIILDDPFSAVDKNTEAQILSDIKKEFSDRLIILISHRITAFSSLDKVLWIDEGKVRVGSHDELYQSVEDYRALYDIQRGLNNV
ncbi:MAG: ABC transporter ATP-binding protein [Clostridia bacterium]|nr:ABC transporter ATP-binding protein [Clostridia bacterium]